MMRRILAVTAATLMSLFGVALVASPAHAGSAHFVDDQLSVTRDGDTLTAAGKVAGLGSEPQVRVVLTATASCINPGDNKPRAANKQSLSVEAVFPVQDGKAYFILSVTAAVDPSSPCPDPMVIVFSGVSVTAAGDTVVVPGTF
jgi:hypothetical protein